MALKELYSSIGYSSGVVATPLENYPTDYIKTSVSIVLPNLHLMYAICLKL
jgi:hypothetical protein